jgi:DNA-binding transcriptional regulator YhcF (GntR family)
MATRQETAQQREEIERKLRERLRNGTLSPGETVPSVREIAHAYGVSSYIAHCALRTLAQEGAFQSTRGRGTFVGRNERSRDKRFLFITDSGDASESHAFMQTGFEDRIARLGGVTGMMSWERLLASASEIAAAGVFHLTSERFDGEFSPGGRLESLARVRFAEKVDHHVETPCDMVSFDDFGGGLLATNTLLNYGHQRIAFLGFHSGTHRTDHYGWSQEREKGWRRAMSVAGLSCEGWSFEPPEEVTESEQIQAARETAARLLRTMQTGGESFAVVAANDRAALGLIAALNETAIPSQQWPAIVGFDSSIEGQKFGLTSLRLPWEEVGRAAADLVWARSDATRSQTFVAPRHSQIEMRLITRTTCATGWAHDFAAEIKSSPLILDDKSAANLSLAA